MTGTAVTETVTVPVGYLDRLRAAVAHPSAPLAFVAAFEVENRWAIGERGLPRQFSGAAPVGASSAELTVLLAGPGDVVVLDRQPDPCWLAQLADLGLALPEVLVARPAAGGLTEAAMTDPAVRQRLSALAGDGGHLVGHGTSDLEETLAAAAGLALAGPPAAVCKAVNSKVWSRRLADRLDLRRPDGFACDHPDRLAEAVAWGSGLLAEGRPVVVKDAFGVSGKGAVVVRPEDGARRLERLAALAARGLGDERLGLVVEEWVDKHLDLTVALTIDRAGQVRVDGIKEAAIAGGVPQGHRLPARLSLAQESDLLAAATAVGEALATAGYFGVVGIDAMTATDGGVWPLVEVNARLNLSTYLSRLLELVAGPEQTVLSRISPLRLTTPLRYDRLAALLGPLRYDPATRTGVVVTATAPLSAGATADGSPWTGRLHSLLVADTAGQAQALDRALTDALTDALTEQ